MQPEWTIRVAHARDANALADLRVALAAEEGIEAELARTFHARCRGFFAAALRDGTVVAWLAEDGGEPVGIAALELRRTLPRARSLRDPTVDGRLRSVYVRPTHRRRGVATALVRAAIAEALRAEVDRLTLGASEVGSRLYVALGFALKDREMVYVGPREATAAEAAGNAPASAAGRGPR